jgi:hypothetical protein
MSESELLDRTQWRSFRLFLAELDEGEFRRVDLQVKHELTARRECETNLTRLVLELLDDE